MSLDLNFASTDAKQNTGLHLATMNGNTKMVFKLMFKFGKFNQKNAKGDSPLSLARKYEFNNIEAVFVLFDSVLTERKPGHLSDA